MVVSTLFRIRVVLAAALMLMVAPLVAQQDNASSPTPALSQTQAIAEPEESDSGLPVFRQSVRRVIVDVVVTDADGKPVPGLTARDFAVAEDGKPQGIRSFDVHDFDSGTDSFPKVPSLPPNTFVNVPAGPERGPLYVLLLDLLNMEVESQPRARQQLMKFILSKPLGTRFAIFAVSDGLHLIQGFTQDRNQLADALDPKNSRSHIPRIFLYAANYRPYVSIPRVLVGIAKFLAPLPGHKNVIWLSEAFPSAILPTATPGSEGENFSDEVKEATDAFAQGQIAVYPIDVRGVVVTGVAPMGFAKSSTIDYAMAGAGKSLADSARSSAPDPGSGEGGAASAAVNAEYMTEEEIASATGGHAFHGTNDLAEALSQATEVGGHYYTLMYSPSNENYNGRLRRIRVELAKRGYRLAYRHSYYGNPNFGNSVERTGDRNSNTSASAPAGALHTAAELEPLMVSHAADSLTPNMQHGAPLAHQLLFRAHIRTVGSPAKATAEQMENLSDQPAYSRGGTSDRPRKALKPVQLQTYEIDYSVAARYPALEVAAAAFDDEGKMLNGEIQRADDNVDAVSLGQRRDGIYRVQQEFDVPVNAVSLRIAVRDVATDNVGALEIDLPLAAESPSSDASARPAISLDTDSPNN